jgi:glucokinase
MGLVVGADIGGTNIKLVGVTEDGEITAQTQVETRDSIADTTEKRRYWVQALREGIEAITRQSGGAVTRVGIAAPGLVSVDGLTIRHMPGRLSGLEGLCWTDELGVGDVVPVINDAQAALVAESWIGAASQVQDAFLLTLGTGVGGAVMLDGAVRRGPTGRLGHLGHMTLDLNGTADICGTPGSLEVFVGEATLAERSAGRFTTYPELIGEYRTGDIAATELWLRTVRALATGISSLVNVLDPQLVLLGGGISTASELGPPLKTYMDELEWRPDGDAVPIRTAELGTYGGAVGAARRAMGGASGDHVTGAEALHRTSY